MHVMLDFLLIRHLTTKEINLKNKKNVILFVTKGMKLFILDINMGVFTFSYQESEINKALCDSLLFPLKKKSQG